MRDRLFHEISKYKKIDSLGKHLNNVNEAGTGFVGHAHECVFKKSPYKFSIASENATFNGYTSEKILTSLEAHTIPIYWGDPLVYNHINPECFINCNDYNSIDELINVIKEIDNDDNLWCQMIAQPWQTEKQKKYSEKINTEYISFFERIFSYSYKDGCRIPEGTRPNIYRKYYFNAKSDMTTKIKRIINKFKKIINCY